MEAVVQSFISGLPILLLHFGITVLMLGLGGVIYVLVTPYHEVELIKKGNSAAALSLSGALVGIGIPLSMAMAGSINALDIIIYGAVAITLQLICYKITDLLIRGLSERIEKGEMSAAIIMVGIKISIALINAASVSV
ncbi:MAG: DUF350 domain-containing protein [Pseudomonadota bacterium]|nr:DUF350 domain-containing protein [Pseudomonadota bacterium]